jgi:membrane fusion protein (multidrug efflux system)
VWTLGPENKATPRPVETGAWLGSDWIILKGLKPGDQVIVDNLLRLRPGVTVQLQAKGGAAGASGGGAAGAPGTPAPAGKSPDDAKKAG